MLLYQSLVDVNRRFLQIMMWKGLIEGGDNTYSRLCLKTNFIRLVEVNTAIAIFSTALLFDQTLINDFDLLSATYRFGYG